MTAKKGNSILWFVAAMLSLGAAGSLLFGFAWPLENEGDVGGAEARSAATKPTTVVALPPLAAYEKIWGLALRQNLGEALPASAAQGGVAASDAAAPLQVTLVGTIGTTLALLKTPTNTVEVRGVGESLNGVTVLAVRPSEVDVRFNGQILKLAKPAEPR